MDIEKQQNESVKVNQVGNAGGNTEYSICFNSEVFHQLAEYCSEVGTTPEEFIKEVLTEQIQTNQGRWKAVDRMFLRRVIRNS